MTTQRIFKEYEHEFCWFATFICRKEGFKDHFDFSLTKCKRAAYKRAAYLSQMYLTDKQKKNLYSKINDFNNEIVNIINFRLY